MRHKWDFFIAHAGGDTNIAENLYAFLKSRSKVFLDSKELILGDTWDQELAQAQRQSLITIVIVSPKTEKAYYQREEIAVAIQMARIDSQKHRVIPIFMPGYDKEKVPYGLTLIHSLTLNSESEIKVAAERLLDAFQKIRKKRDVVKETTDIKENIFKIELQTLGTAKEILNTQLSIFDRARITPQDCDEIVQNFLAVKAPLNQILANDHSKSIASHLILLYKLDENILELINIFHQFRNISIQTDTETEKVKQQIITRIQSLIKDFDLLIFKLRI